MKCRRCYFISRITRIKFYSDTNDSRSLLSSPLRIVRTEHTAQCTCRGIFFCARRNRCWPDFFLVVVVWLGSCGLALYRHSARYVQIFSLHYSVLFGFEFIAKECSQFWSRVELFIGHNLCLLLPLEVIAIETHLR